MTDDIKQKLKEYRERKRLQEENVAKESGKVGFSIFKRNIPENSSSSLPSAEGVVDPSEILVDDNIPRPWTDRIQYFLGGLLIWLVIYVVALKFEFGIVYMIATGFYLLWISLNTKKRKKPNELSAYSVFNPNCERLLGQTTAEQFENEILRRQPT